MTRIGIMAALHGEVAGLLSTMGAGARVQRVGGRDYHIGQLLGCECVIVLARVGKVAAAATAVTLVREFGATQLLFTGLAGAVASHVRVGDVVVAQSLLQHDMDASPLFPRYEIPLLGRSRFASDVAASDRLAQCAVAYLEEDFMAHAGPELCQRFGLGQPSVHRGMIVSGDCFVNDAQGVARLRDCLPDALCVEMEGAAVAQICHEYEVPFAVVRTISDRADDTAGIDFSAFLSLVASVYSAGILHRYLESATASAQP